MQDWIGHLTFMFPTAAIFLFSLVVTSVSAQDFLSAQKRFPRVRTALAEKGETVAADLTGNGLDPGALRILFVAYKAGRALHLYARSPEAAEYRHVKTFAICASSGIPGPKRREGDNQVPEGFYHIDRFNPSSNFYLSLGINYPNVSDKILSDPRKPGGDIFIHGSCVTIGCLPMTDEGIREIYLYALYARADGQKEIPVYIFPFEMTDRNLQAYAGKYPARKMFWENLKEGHDLFMRDHKALKIVVDAKGKYLF